MIRKFRNEHIPRVLISGEILNVNADIVRDPALQPTAGHGG